MQVREPKIAATLISKIKQSAATTTSNIQATTTGTAQPTIREKFISRTTNDHDHQ
jgi:hypothetical protein